MSGVSAVNKAAAQSVSGGDPELEMLIETGLGLIHVLQVYTSSMVRPDSSSLSSSLKNQSRWL